MPVFAHKYWLSMMYLGIHTHTYTHMYICNKEKEAVNLKEGRGWGSRDMGGFGRGKMM